MKRIIIFMMFVCLVGCSQDKLTFKSDFYGTSSKVVGYFEEGKATKALSKTVLKQKEKLKRNTIN